MNSGSTTPEPVDHLPQCGAIHNAHRRGSGTRTGDQDQARRRTQDEQRRNDQGAVRETMPKEQQRQEESAANKATPPRRPESSDDKRDQCFGPVELPNGMHAYTVRGVPFEVIPQYKLTKLLGTGAYGTVCSGSRDGQAVAIKKCAGVFKNLEDGKRVLREIKLMQYIQHDNVLKVLDILPSTARHKFDDVYMVTDLMNSDLSKVLRSQQKLTDDHYQYFMYQLLKALKYVHSANVMHRDLKPANILVNWSCDLKLCDFGLSRGFNPYDCLQELTGYVVTRYYRPPELLVMSTQYTPAIDIWSAGCIFAELMIRRPLFKGKNHVHEMQLITENLGSPNETDLTWLKDDAAVRFIKSMPQSKGKQINEIVPKTMTSLAEDFLSKMLVFSPVKRQTAEQLLEHPYLAAHRDPKTEASSRGTFSWEYDRKEVKERDLRHLFWLEMCRYRPELEMIDAPGTNQLGDNRKV